MLQEAPMSFSDSDHIIIIDIGSTTTKGLLLEKLNGRWHFKTQADVPTTVEKPCEDVKIGVRRAIDRLQNGLHAELTGEDGVPSVPCLATSSAGGGLQIMVFGLSSLDTGKAAELTANGSGGVILRTFTVDDRVPAIQKMRLIRELHPDMILMAGGMDGGNIASVVRLAEILSLADPTPKFVQNEKIPLVFCGNIKARDFITSVLAGNFEVHHVDNIRPAGQELNTAPAKEKIHRLFMDNVMERAPGYTDLKPWMAAGILPTPSGVEKILRLYSEKTGYNVVMVDMGGATTDIFSNIKGSYSRTVAANIGMSYSISNIMAEAGIDALMAHLPKSYDVDDVRDYISNKMLNPTYVPGSGTEIQVEQAAAVEGIRLAWRQHLEMNFSVVKTGIMDRLRIRDRLDPFQELLSSKDRMLLFQASDIELLIGAGGVISFTKSHEEAIRILVDGFLPVGVTRLGIDVHFKSPHMGILSTQNPDLALELFSSECFKEIGTVIAPTGEIRPGKAALTVVDRKTQEEMPVYGGEIRYLPGGGDLEVIPGKRTRIHPHEGPVSICSTLPILLDCRGRKEHFIGRPLAAYTVPGFSIPGGEFRTGIRRPASEPQVGSYAFLRALPYEGEIFVREGDRVSPETLIGQNRFTPPLIFIIDLQHLVGYDYPLSHKAIETGLLVKTGDSINTGDLIFKTKRGTLAAETHFYSPVRGRIVHIEANGMIILREIQDYSLQPTIIDIARQMGIKPAHIRGYLKFKQGDFIQAGQSLVKLAPGKPLITSPKTGTLQTSNTTDGTIVIKYDLEPVRMESFVSGTITHVKENWSALVEGQGVVLHGIIGFGKDTSGTLHVLHDSDHLNAELQNRIVIYPQPVDARFLSDCASAGVRGVIIPSIRNAEWVAFSGREISVALTGDEDIPLTVILTEGFGTVDMLESDFRFLKEMEGRIASLRGRTQIRAGVTRPMAVISPR